MTILVKSKTANDAKNRFGTSWECFNDAKYLFKRDTGKDLVLDVAAEPNTAKLKYYYASSEWLNSLVSGYDDIKPSKNNLESLALNPQCVGFNALAGEWRDGWYCNPPFDQKVLFIQKAVEQARKGRAGMMLLPDEQSTGWWIKHVEGYASMIYQPDGRYSFFHANGRIKMPGVNFASLLILFSERALHSPRQRIQRNMHSICLI